MDAAIYPGSFDPITYGHPNIIERAQSIFSQVVVLVAVNPQKSYLFSTDEKVEMIREATREWPRVEVDRSEGLLVEYARSRQIHIAVRGLRALPIRRRVRHGLTNRTLWPEMDTVFLMTRSDYMPQFVGGAPGGPVGGDIGSFVPPAVERRLRAKFGRLSMFIDEVTITVESGGGDGCMSFRRGSTRGGPAGTRRRGTWCSGPVAAGHAPRFPPAPHRRQAGHGKGRT